jgi:hypothetical protein
MVGDPVTMVSGMFPTMKEAADNILMKAFAVSNEVGTRTFMGMYAPGAPKSVVDEIVDLGGARLPHDRKKEDVAVISDTDDAAEPSRTTPQPTNPLGAAARAATAAWLTRARTKLQEK